MVGLLERRKGQKRKPKDNPAAVFRGPGVPDRGIGIVLTKGMARCARAFADDPFRLCRLFCSSACRRCDPGVACRVSDCPRRLATEPGDQVRRYRPRRGRLSGAQSVALPLASADAQGQGVAAAGVGRRCCGQPCRGRRARRHRRQVTSGAEHQAFIFLLRLQNGKTLVLYDHDSHAFAQDDRPSGTPTPVVRDRISLRTYPVSQRKHCSFGGETLPLPVPIELALAPENWPEDESWCRVKWENIERHFGPNASRQAAASKRS